MTIAWAIFGWTIQMALLGSKRLSNNDNSNNINNNNYL